jgi:CRISPR-associated endonuclease/helicase Cas3
MTVIHLQAHAEKLAPLNALPEYHHEHPLLYHQVRTYGALKQYPLVMNTYPTGTGKTIAALLQLLNPEQQHRNTLFIAPTNALISQHANDIREFIDRYGLKMRVFEANAASLGALDSELRPGERLQRFLENPLTFLEQLGLPNDAEKLPFVVVTNPDIFYYGLYFQYQRNDQRNVFSKFIGNFNYVVIDEFHYYDNKQFANFLFFFALWKQWGYFDSGRSVCLLSATPRANIYIYLSRLFGKDGWTMISPDNEPAESAELKTVQTLSELELHIVADQIETWVRSHQVEIEAWQTNDLDGVIISSSLGRINQINASLRHLDPVRITGPEPQAERQRIRPLILATPTVDIGYNFGRPGKRRQSIDRLICDVRFGDELTQRIGRAGRVLGKSETDQLSMATVLMSEEAAEEFRQYNGQSLSRHEWANIVDQLQNLLPKHQLDSYIRSQAMMEAFYPISHISEMDSDTEATLEELYELIRSVFAPQSKTSKKYLQVFFKKYERRRRWLNEKTEAKRWALDEWNTKALAEHFADYVSWLKSRNGKNVRCPSSMFLPHLQNLLLNQPKQKAEVLAFIESQVTLSKAIFNFREAWQGPGVLVYDPKHLLSSETVNRYDLLHLITNYQLSIFKDKREFNQHTVTEETADLYIELRDFRDTRLSLGFDYLSPYPKEEFEDRYCRRIVSLRGMQLIAKEQGKGGSPVSLDERLRSSIVDQWIPCLIVAEESWWPLISVVHGTPFYTRELLVDYPDGHTITYKVITGTAAFHVLPHLKRHFAMLDKQLYDEAIIL